MSHHVSFNLISVFSWISGEEPGRGIMRTRSKIGGSPGPQFAGKSMLDLDLQKRRALQIVVLRTEVQKGKYGAAHHFDWKRVGLSRAYFKRELVREKVMPTPRAKADLRYLMKPVQPQKVQQDGKHVDSLYYRLRKMQRERIAANASLNITSYDLFANMRYMGF